MSASPPRATVDFQNLFGREGPIASLRTAENQRAFSPSHSSDRVAGRGIRHGGAV